MSRYEKKMKDKLDDEIKLAGIESLVPEELEKHLILNSNRLRDPMDVDAINSIASGTGENNSHRDDFECLLDDDGFKHTDIQIQRRSERHGRTLGFKDSHVNNLVTSDQSNVRRETEDGV